MADHFASRLERAARRAADVGLTGLVVTPSADLLYLTAYDPPPLERLTALVLRSGRDPILVVPELERPLAEAAALDRLAEVVAWGDTEDPYELVARLVPRDGRYGAAARMWAAHLLRLQAALPHAAFESAAPVLSALRALKDADEVELLRKAARGADETFHRVANGRLEGAREEDIAAELAVHLRDLGHREVNFTIVASGPNGASPHHEPTGRTILAGDAVVLDFGGRVGGYCSDLSRTVSVQRPPEGFDAVYEAVREAQDAAFAAVAVGVPAEEVDRAARSVIERAGYGPRFIHRTGHGIGLEEHEPPYIVAGNRERLLPGMCFSIEPGVYLDGRFGVRIEDIVTVTENGPVRLNHAPREPVLTA